MRGIEPGPSPENAEVPRDFAPGPAVRLSAALVCVLTFLAYIHTLSFQFVHDDRGQIIGNPALRSWHAIPAYFTSQVWAGVAPSALGNDYRPLFLLWLRVNAALFRIHPAGWHLATLAAHVAATYFVFLLARKVFQNWPAAMFCGLVFGLHPVHIEGVAWISGAPEPLLAALLIPAYLCWVRFRENGGELWRGASLGLYALAMLMKETAVVLPLILFVSQWLDYPRPLNPLPGGPARKSLRILKVLLPFLALTAGYLVVRTVVLQGFSHPAAQVNWLTVVLTWPSLLMFYLRLLAWPVGLSPFYGLKFVSHPTLGNAVVPTLLLLLVGLGLWRWAKVSRPVALAIPWLVFPLLPVLNIQVFGNGNFAHNRYLYVPSIGFAMLVADALRRIRYGKPALGGVPSLQAAACLGLTLVMGVAIPVEDRYYANDAAFYGFAYAHDLDKDPVIGVDYANSLAEQGDFGRAAAIYGEVIHAHPDAWSAYFNVGYMYYQMGRLDLARQYLSRAAADDPANAGAVFYLGLTNLKLNRLDEAEASLRRAIVLAPTKPTYHFALGMVLKLKGDSAGALAEFSRELELHPWQQAAAQQVAEIQKQMMRK